MPGLTGVAHAVIGVDVGQHVSAVAVDLAADVADVVAGALVEVEHPPQ